MIKSNTQKTRKYKVFVGMSGGVDSSVSVAILKNEGHDVTGVFIKGWYPEYINCPWKEERYEAMRVASKLNIPFITLDLEKEYKKEVVEYLINEYKKGNTPNPDVMCNKYVKFGGFLKFAIKNGADYIATGHYARIIDNKLFMGEDKNKDQSYFLWTLTKNEVNKVIFPVGGLEKKKVRILAKKFKLPNYDKKDSQGICFMGEVDMKEFLKRELKPKTGNVLDEKGNIIGSHSGSILYTIGERHGFLITKKNPHDSQYYIISKDIKNNTITVSHNKFGELSIIENENESNATKIFSKIILTNVNFIKNEPDFSKEYSARIRYRQPLFKCHLKKHEEKGKYIMLSDESISMPSAGQSAVIYDGEECIGGGIIEI